MIVDRSSLFALAVYLLSGASGYAADSRDHPARDGDAHYGLELAKNWCASCHPVSDAPGPRKNAPTFATIAQSAGFSADRLAYLLYDPHPAMAKLALSRQAIEHLAAYIMSLKEK